MSSMMLPGFTAEVSAYRTTRPYRLASGGSAPGGVDASVVPQDCGIVAGIACGTIIAGGVVVCTASCLASAELGGIPCYLCWTGYLGALYGFCRDCLPDWIRAILNAVESGGGGGGTGGGGGGGSTGGQCGCPASRPKCCGECIKVGGRRQCDDACVARNQVCP